ncbi:DNA-binding transcriptional regulator, GntR family [Sinosporangium album]|uniref:DNA-binding transcriptional regulator, GntR family n=1 Tax=Sinosporangium album TaxID=504805 RepID=A0A1G8FQ53_9ACTN|nr:GntR family transcriptional regulator [Sinosporangium album]SDH84261.1 DNA-binding transcriptional regulator, GntR family [Sinosporangium album]
MATVQPRAMAIRSRSDLAVERLKTSILSGELRPGQRLVPAVLGEAWGISQTPMREAFQRLAATGLIELVDQKGAHVTAISPEDCKDLFTLRASLEGDALRRSIATGPPGWQQRAQDAYTALAENLHEDMFSNAEKLDSFDQAHREFHLALISGARSHWLTHVIELLMDNSIRYRLGTLRYRGASDALLEEHKRMLDAALANDADLLVQLNDAHLAKTIELTQELATKSE